jgi:PAS domain S-box-containing protein
MKHPTRKQILNTIPEGIVALDKSGQVIFINDEAVSILNVDRVSKAGSLIDDLLPATVPAVSECLETGHCCHRIEFSSNNQKFTGNIFPILTQEEVSGAVFTFQQQLGYDAAFQHEKFHEYLNNELQTIINSSPDGVLIADNKGDVLYLNTASQKLIGLSEPEVLGKNLRDFIDEGILDRSVTLKSLSTKKRESLNVYCSKSKKHILSTATPIFDNDGNIIMIVVNERDMTELNALREELEQTRKMGERYRQKLEENNLWEVKNEKIVIASEKMHQVMKAAMQLSKIDDADILILGESGTGKGLIAKLIHHHSRRNKKSLIQVNCAALPESLLEAELFGYEPGAFTGARNQGKAGLFELAHGGTLFLDEIGDMPISIQSKILTYLDNHHMMRLGGTDTKQIDCSVIAATNTDIEKLVSEKRFREDLYYRLNTFMVKIPPLRERSEDIFELVNHFLATYNRKYKYKKKISVWVYEKLISYPFPGNVRELRSIINRAVAICEDEVIDDAILNAIGHEKHTPTMDAQNQNKLFQDVSLKDRLMAVEKTYLKHAIEHSKTTREMAKLLNISQASIVRRLKKYNLSLG